MDFNAARLRGVQPQGRRSASRKSGGWSGRLQGVTASETAQTSDPDTDRAVGKLQLEQVMSLGLLRQRAGRSTGRMGEEPQTQARDLGVHPVTALRTGQRGWRPHPVDRLPLPAAAEVRQRGVHTPPVRVNGGEAHCCLQPVRPGCARPSGQVTAPSRVPRRPGVDAYPCAARRAPGRPGGGSRPRRTASGPQRPR